MKKFYLLIVILFFISISVKASVFSTDSVKIKPVYKFGGTLNLNVYYDTYKSLTIRNSLGYFYPLAPNINDKGVDLNNDGQLNFSVFSSRLNFGVSNVKVAKSTLSAYIEGDFLGTAETFLQIFRLRHAFVKFQWENDMVLLGQTSHLTTVDEVVANTISFGSGIPFNPLNRGVQVRYAHRFSKITEVLVAAQMYGHHNSVGPTNAQAKASIPDMQAQIKLGTADNIFGGFTVGAKFLQPRSVTDDGYATNKIVPSFDFSAFLRISQSGYTVKLWSMYGQNLTMLYFIGGYGKVLSDKASGDYNYSNVSAFSSWVDVDTPIFSNFQFGLFAGYQKNLGSDKELDLTKDKDGQYKYGYYRDCNLMGFMKVSPRVYYHLGKKIVFGLEYSYSQAKWAEQVDNRFRATKLYDPTYNNRVEFLTRFVF